jgi:Family of unknown function (DUF6152)
MRLVLPILRSCQLMAVLLLAASAPCVMAHHSFAVHFVDDRVIDVSGTVTAFRFANPHGMLAFDVRKEDGSVEHWRAETNSPNVLRRRGWSKDSLQPGDSITVTGFPSRDGTPYIRISRVKFADGRELVGQGMAAPADDKE